MSFNVTLPISRELVTRVFDFLPLQDQARAALVCKDFAYAAAPAMLRKLQEKDKILRERLKPLIDTLSEEGKKAASKKLVIDNLSKYPLDIQLGIIQECHNIHLKLKIAAILKESLGLPSSDMDSVAVCVLRRRSEDVASNLFDEICLRQKNSPSDSIYNEATGARAFALIALAIPDDKSSETWSYVSTRYQKLRDLSNALLFARKIGDFEKKSRRLMEISDFCFQNHLPDDLASLEEALVAARMMEGDLLLKCDRLMEISERYDKFSQPEEALGALGEAFLLLKHIKTLKLCHGSVESIRFKKISETYEILGDLPNALAAAREVLNKNIQSQRLLKLSEAYRRALQFSNARSVLNEALLAAKSVCSNEERCERLLEISREYRSFGAEIFLAVLNDALIAVRGLPAFKQSDKFGHISKFYEEIGDLSKALGVAMEMTVGPSRDSRLIEISQLYEMDKDLDKALVVAKAMSENHSKWLRIVYISQRYEAIGDLANAIGSAKEISNQYIRSIRLTAIGLICETNLDLDNLLAVTKANSDATEVKSLKLKRISKTYEQKGDSEKALAVAKEITSETIRGKRVKHLERRITFKAKYGGFLEKIRYLKVF